MSAELVPTNNGISEIVDRRSALEQLGVSAETSNDPEEANALRIHAAVIGDALKRMGAHKDEIWLARKAYVLAARRIGALLLNVEAGTGGKGRPGSPRTQLIKEMGISRSLGYYFLQLAQIPDPEFQRYIQDREKMPSINGALGFCLGSTYSGSKDVGSRGQWADRRRVAGVKTPRNPSIDKAHVELLRSLGNLSPHCTPHGNKGRDLRKALWLMYEAEDLIRPYMGGYGE